MAIVGNRVQHSRGNVLVTNYSPQVGRQRSVSEEVSEPGPVAGLLTLVTFEEGTSGTTLAVKSGIVPGSGGTYQSAAVVHGTLGAQLTGSSANFKLRCPGHSFQGSVYGSFAAMVVGTSSFLNLDDETLATATGGGVTFVSADGLVGHFAVHTGTGSDTAATGTLAIGDLFRLDFKVDYNNGNQTNTVDCYYRGNIEGTVPDETIAATHSVTATSPWMRWGNNNGFTTYFDTLRIYDFATAPAPFNPSSNFSGPAGLSGSGTLSAAASLPTLATTGGLSGSGTLTASAVPALTAAAALSGSGTLAATAVPGFAAPAGLSGSGTLTATASSPAIVTSASLSGTGTLSASASGPSLSTTAGLSGSGTLTASGKPALAANAALSGGGTLTASAVPAVTTTAALAGSGTLTAGVVPKVATAAALSGTGTLTGATSGSGVASASLAGTGTVSAATQPAVSTPAALSGTGTVSATGRPGLAATAALAGAGALSATATPGQSSTAVLAGDGTLTALATLATSTAAALLGNGTLTAARPPSNISAYLAAAQPDNDPGAVAALRSLTAWENRRRVRHGTSSWIGPISISPTGVVLNLAITSGTTTPADADWTIPTYVAGRAGYLLTNPPAVGQYSLWARDATGTPARFATITVT